MNQADENDANDAKKALASQTLLRGLDIMEAVSKEPLGITEIARRTGITYSTAHRIISALVQRNYVRPSGNRGFILGRKTLELGFLAFHQSPLMRVAHPLLEDLARETQDTVHLVSADGDSVIYLDKIPGQRSVEISSRIGGRKPLISTGVGKALILDWTEQAWGELYDREGHLLEGRTTREQFLEQMRQYAAGGYSFDLGEDVQTIRCVAVPLRDGSRKIIAAISVSSTLEYMGPERMQALVPVVKGVAARISAEQGLAPENAPRR